MARRWFTLGACMSAALLLGAAMPADHEDGEMEKLRSELASISETIRANELRLEKMASRDQLLQLQQRLDALDDEAWEEAVELGIARRFARARTGLTPAGERRAAAAVVREARAAGLDPLLVAGLIEVESTYRNFAVSPVGAVGLMQVMPATGAWFGKKIGVPDTGREELFDPERNIQVGVHYLAELKRQFGRMDLALVAYNAGPGKAREIAKSGELQRWLENYPKKVFAAQRKIRVGTP